jgi:hypothetical protein
MGDPFPRDQSAGDHLALSGCDAAAVGGLSRPRGNVEIVCSDPDSSVIEARATARTDRAARANAECVSPYASCRRLAVPGTHGIIVAISVFMGSRRKVIGGFYACMADIEAPCTLRCLL